MRTVETKRIKCPSCGVLLDVRNSQNEAVKMIICPQCKAQLRVIFSQNNGKTQYVDSGNGVTRYVGQTSFDNSDETVLAGNKAILSPGYLTCGGDEYPLKFGINVIGRNAVSSQATIQIATEDRYMSRQHLTIQVVKVSSDKIRVVVANYHNKNASYVNGQLLNEGDQLILSEGSIIKMGNTTVAYHQ